MIHQEPGGQGRIGGQDHAQHRRRKHPHSVRPHGRHVQPERLVPAHGPGVKQHQQRAEAQQAVRVVPPLKGNAPQQHDEPRLGDGRLVPHGKGEIRKIALVKGALERPVEPVEQRAGQVRQSAQDPAGAAPGPRAGRGPLPAQHAEDPRAVDLGAAPAARRSQQPVERALFIDGAQRRPQCEQEAFLKGKHRLSPSFRSGFSGGTSGSG